MRGIFLLAREARGGASTVADNNLAQGPALGVWLNAARPDATVLGKM